MSRPSFFLSLEPCCDPLQPTLEQDNPRVDRWIASASVSSVSNCCNLDMCTDALGFENGAMCFDYELETNAERRKRLPEKSRSAAPMEFPPLLTTLRGEARLRLRRESVAGKVSLIGFRPWVVEADRCGGRLVLRIPARADLNERGKEQEKEKEEEEKVGGGKTERGEMVMSYGCGGKFRNVAAMFSSDAFLLAT